MNINYRFIAYLESKKITQKDMAGFLGLSKSAVSAIKNSKSTPTTAQIALLAEKFNLLNIRWLFTGEGEMESHKGNSVDNSSPVIENSYSNCPFCGDKERIIKSMEKHIELLEFMLGKNRKTGSE